VIKLPKKLVIAIFCITTAFIIGAAVFLYVLATNQKSTQKQGQTDNAIIVTAITSPTTAPIATATTKPTLTGRSCDQACQLKEYQRVLDSIKYKTNYSVSITTNVDRTTGCHKIKYDKGNYNCSAYVWNTSDDPSENIKNLKVINSVEYSQDQAHYEAGTWSKGSDYLRSDFALFYSLNAISPTKPISLTIKGTIENGDFYQDYFSTGISDSLSYDYTGPESYAYYINRRSGLVSECTKLKRNLSSITSTNTPDSPPADSCYDQFWFFDDKNNLIEYSLHKTVLTRILQYSNWGTTEIDSRIPQT